MNAPEASWRHGLQSRTRFVAEVDGEVAGTVSGGPGKATGVAAVTAMWVDPRFRKRGIGRLLLEHVLDWSESQGYREACLWVTDRNDDAERLYVRHGFARTGDQEEVRPGRLEFELSKTLR